MSIAYRWTISTDDTMAAAMVEKVVQNTKELAKQRGLEIRVEFDFNINGTFVTDRPEEYPSPMPVQKPPEEALIYGICCGCKREKVPVRHLSINETAWPGLYCWTCR